MMENYAKHIPNAWNQENARISKDFFFPTRNSFVFLLWARFFIPPAALLYSLPIGDAFIPQIFRKKYAKKKCLPSKALFKKIFFVQGSKFLYLYLSLILSWEGRILIKSLTDRNELEINWLIISREMTIMYWSSQMKQRYNKMWKGWEGNKSIENTEQWSYTRKNLHSSDIKYVHQNILTSPCPFSQSPLS